MPNDNGGNALIWHDGDVTQDGNKKLRRPPRFVLALELFHASRLLLLSLIYLRRRIIQENVCVIYKIRT